MITGIIGLGLLAVGWMYEAVQIIKEKKSRLGLKFSILYTTGSLLLVIYSIQVKDVIFTILNGLVTAISLVSLAYSIRK